MTDFRTLDSYQYRIMNTLSAMNELADVLNSRLCRIHNTNHNIDECKAETMSIVKGDPIFQNNYPMYWNSVLDHLAGKTETDAWDAIYAVTAVNTFVSIKTNDSA